MNVMLVDRSERLEGRPLSWEDNECIRMKSPVKETRLCDRLSNGTRPPSTEALEEKQQH